jgi:hypothetical protein
MSRIAPLDLGISPHVYAVMSLFCLKERETLAIADPYEEDHTDIRMTAYYRPTNRGGVLVRVRRSVDEPDPFLHLVVIPKEGEPEKIDVFEWVAPYESVPPTAVPLLHNVVSFDEDAIIQVVNHLFRRIREHLQRVRRSRR